MTQVLNIYFSDLKEEAQAKVLDIYGVKDKKELNMDLDVIPMFTLEIEKEDEDVRI